MGIDKWLKGKGKQFQEWKAKAPERRKVKHETNMEKMTFQLQEMKLKKEITKNKTDMMKDKIKIDKQRKEAMGEMPSMFGSNGGFGSPTGSPTLGDKHKEEPMPDVAELFGFGGQDDKQLRKGKPFP